MRVLAVFALLVCLFGAPVSAATVADTLDRLLDEPVRVDAVSDNTAGVYLGIFRGGELTELAEEAPGDLRFKPAAAMWFTRFGGAFPESEVRYLWSKGYLAQVTWEPMDWRNEEIPLQDIVDGKWDQYIDAYAKVAARLDIPFMLRWGHEFNGDWYPWALAKNGNTPARFVAAYRRIVDRFRAAGAKRVQFVWCFNNESTPKTVDPFDAWPGADYVDWVGIDGYNWGTTRSWGQWASFEQVFGAAYALAVKRAPGKPIVIGEMASSEAGGDKAAWLTEMFNALPRYPAIRALTWFDITKETSWSIASSDEAYIAFIEGLKRPYWRGNAEAMSRVARP